MKYKRQITAGIFTLALITGGSPTFGAAPEVTVPKMVQAKHQLSMRSDDLSDDGEIEKIQTRHHHKRGRARTSFS